jgi:hypothetical protein
MTVYACGLRVSGGDTAEDHRHRPRPKAVASTQCKGAKERVLPLSERLLKLGNHKLRVLWRALPPVVHRHWGLIFSLVPTAQIDTGRRAPAVTGIVRLPGRQKLAMARKTDTQSLTDQLLPLRLHSAGGTQFPDASQLA